MSKASPKSFMNEDFVRDLSSLINAHSLENVANVPDFMLASYAACCLDALCRAIETREEYFGVKLIPGQLPKLSEKTYSELVAAWHRASPATAVPYPTAQPIAWPNRRLTDGEISAYKTGLWYTFQNDNHAKDQRSFFLREKRGSTAFGHFNNESDYPEEHPLAHLNLASARIEP